MIGYCYQCQKTFIELNQFLYANSKERLTAV